VVDLRVETSVDSELARYYLESYLPGKHTDAALSSKIDSLHHTYQQSTPSRDALGAIALEYSVDFAALFFARRLLVDECNAALNRSFTTYLNSRASPDAGIVASYLVLFVPGWDYAENGAITGADFARPRVLATQFGLENYLVELPPTGSVEQNAAFLANEIVKRGASGKKLIVVGASSAGPAIHLTLGRLLNAGQRQLVKAWLNLGGILQGSPLVDYLLARPWLMTPVIWFTGWDEKAIQSMATVPSQQRFADLRVDTKLLVVNYLGIPLSGQLSRHSEDKYPILSAQGPNDGLTLLTDAIAPNSLTIVALGSDHFFAEDPRINEKTVALMKLMLALVESGATSDGKQCSRLRVAEG
jgi:hypothetical protein